MARRVEHQQAARQRQRRRRGPGGETLHRHQRPRADELPRRGRLRANREPENRQAAESERQKRENPSNHVTSPRYGRPEGLHYFCSGLHYFFFPSSSFGNGALDGGASSPVLTYVDSLSRVSLMSRFRIVSWPMRSCGVNADSPFSIVRRSGL